MANDLLQEGGFSIHASSDLGGPARAVVVGGGVGRHVTQEIRLTGSGCFLTWELITAETVTDEWRGSVTLRSLQSTSKSGWGDGGGAGGGAGSLERCAGDGRSAGLKGD